MEQYILKAALEAEIKKRRDKNARNKLNLAAAFEDNYLLSFLDTLKVQDVDLEDVVDDAKDLAMRDLAWKVHVMISEGKSISEIDHYVCGICDF